MEKELNIAAILKDKSKGTKLWSPIFGDCELAYICEKELEYVPIRVTKKNFGTAYFEKDGKSHKDGDCVLFPSKQMQSWSKFAWKKGDVLSCGVDNLCIFKKWENDEYTEFDAEFVTPNYSGTVLKTKDWVKATNKNTINQYIAKIEKTKGGKLNLETLEIEQSKQEFKDGDILYVEKNGLFPSCVFIYQNHEYNDEEDVYCYARYNYENCKVDVCSAVTIDNRNIRWATKEEKKELFEHLKMKGKRWNPDTKQIENLSKKCEFEAFQKVLTRDTLDEKWRPNLFSNYNRENSEYMYGCISGGCDAVYSKYCIPYNEETKHLLGTTDEGKGGEG